MSSPAPTSASPHPAVPARWLALDVFRALAVLWMIQGHTFTALLGGGDIFAGAFGHVYRVLHGLTAPMFLCGAGLAYGIVSSHAPRPPAPGRFLRRALLLFAIGTVLQLPAAPISREDWARALQPAALQLIAACLVLAELLRRATAPAIALAQPQSETADRVRLGELAGARLGDATNVGAERERSARRGAGARFAAVMLGVSIAIAMVGPWAWELSLSERYLLGSWVDGLTGAQFPLVPWLSFFMLGAAISALLGASLWRERLRMPIIGLSGLALSALCFWQFQTGQRLQGLYGAHDFWLTSPMLVAFRAGLVLAWLALLSSASGLIVRCFAAWPSVKRVIGALSQHSLVAYVVHLGMLYGLPPLRSGAARPFTLLETSAICALILIVSVLCVLHWERMRALAMTGVSKLTGPKRALSPPCAAPRDPLA